MIDVTLMIGKIMKTKRFLLALVAMMLPFVLSAETVEINGIRYNLITKGQVAEVIYKYYSGDLVIPGNVTYQGVSCSVTSIGSSAFSGCSGLTSVTIPNSVTSIGSSAFSGCSGLTSVTIPNSVTKIDQSAFSGCSSLTSVTIPNSVTSIGEDAFSGCSSLTSVTIPNSVTSIGKRAFMDSGLTSVTIPSSVTSISGFAFYGCRSLTSVHISDLKAWCGISFANEHSNPLGSVHHLYLNGEEIKDLVIPNDVTNIGRYVFQGCIGLTSVTIPNSVTSIGSSAFSGCSGLTSVTIPNSVTSIGGSAFSGCENLTDVTCLAKNVPDTHTSAFANSYIDYATLHVYESSVDAYKRKEPWSKFKYIVAADIPMFALTYIVDGAVYKSVKYEEGDEITPEPEPTRDGYTFSGWSEIPETMPGMDVTVTGSFTIAKYKLTYMVDGEEYKSYEMKYGSTIIPEAEPTKEGYTFSGWSEIPEEMPAHDVIVTGTFTKIPVEEPQLVTPSISIIKGKLVFTCEEDGVTYHYGITTPAAIQGEGNDVEFIQSCKVSVYASKQGFKDSEIATKNIVIKSGDVNLDGKVDVADHVELTNIIMNK